MRSRHLAGVATDSELLAIDGYAWAPWSTFCYCERFKDGAAAIASVLGAIAGATAAVGAPLPTGPRFCECVRRPGPGPFEFKAYLLLASVVTIVVGLVYAGLVRPLADATLGRSAFGKAILGAPVPAYYATTGRGCLRLLSAALALGAVAVLTVAYVVLDVTTGATPLDKVLAWFGDRQPSSSSALSPSDATAFGVYVALLAWESVELVGAVVCVRWPSPRARISQWMAAASASAAVPKTAAAAAAGMVFELGGSMSDPSTIMDSVGNSSSATLAGGADRSTATVTLDGSTAEALPLTRGQQAHRRSYFVVAAHNSSSKLRCTLEHLLIHTEPANIVVADNGSNELMTLDQFHRPDVCALASRSHD